MKKITGRLKGFHAILTAMLLSLLLASCAGFGTTPASEFDTGMLLFDQGKYKQAARHFERAAEADPQNASAYLYLGRSRLNIGEYRDAVPPLRAAYRLAPQEMKKQALDLLLDALFGAAKADWDIGHFKASIDDLKEAYNLDPQSSRTKGELTQYLINLATILLTANEPAEAAKQFAEALDISPDNLSAYIGLAQALLKKGDYKEALDAALKALKLDPKNTEALKLLLDIKTK